MRNLKKILALVLALVMSFSLMATANAFTDDENITDTYETAVTVLSGLKVFQGYDDGSFLPQGSITRAEVAAIIYRIVTGDVDDTQVGIYADYNKFDDVKSTSWYAGYVNFCANAEYIKGYDAKTFGPNDPVTGYQALAMILRALGYDKNGEFTGTSWQVQTAAVGENRGITKNITAGTLGVAATREVVAEILFRAILVDTVSYTPAFGYQLNDTSLGWETFKLEEITGVVVANEYADLYGASALKAGKTELDVDGDIYSLDYATEITDIGEARDAYVTGGTVLYIADAGNTVFETGAETDISTAKKFESATGMERGDAEDFINFDDGSDDTYEADIRIVYSLTGKDADAVSIKAGATLTSKQYSDIKDIFTDDDLADGWVVVGTKYDAATAADDDISNDVTFRNFVKEYLVAGSKDTVEVNDSENGEWLKVIDNDGDGEADYVFKTEFAMAEIENITSKGVYTFSDLVATDAPSIELLTADEDEIVTSDELAEGDVVIYTVIDGVYYVDIAEMVTGTVDKKGINSKTETMTVDGTDYVQSHIGYSDAPYTTYDYYSDVTEGHTEETYDLYLDHFGYVRLFVESAYNRGFVLLTDGYFYTDYRTDEFQATIYDLEAEELVDVDVTDNAGAETFIDTEEGNDHGNRGTWDRLKEAGQVYFGETAKDDPFITNIAAYTLADGVYSLNSAYNASNREDYYVHELDNTGIELDDRELTSLNYTDANDDGWRLQTVTSTQYYLVVKDSDNDIIEILTWVGYKNAPDAAELGDQTVAYAVAHESDSYVYDVVDIVVFETNTTADKDTYFVYAHNNWYNTREYVWGIGYGENDEIVDDRIYVDEDNTNFAGDIEFYVINDDGEILTHINANYDDYYIYAGLVNVIDDTTKYDYFQVAGTAKDNLYFSPEEGADEYAPIYQVVWNNGAYDVEIMDDWSDIPLGSAMILFTDSKQNVEYAIYVGSVPMLLDAEDAPLSDVAALWKAIVDDANYVAPVEPSDIAAATVALSAYASHTDIADAEDAATAQGLIDTYDDLTTADAASAQEWVEYQAALEAVADSIAAYNKRNAVRAGYVGLIDTNKGGWPEGAEQAALDALDAYLMNLTNEEIIGLSDASYAADDIWTDVIVPVVEDLQGAEALENAGAVIVKADGTRVAAEDLATAVAQASTGDEIVLQESTRLDAALTINVEGITLNGNGNSIVGQVEVVANDVTLENVSVTSSNAVVLKVNSGVTGTVIDGGSYYVTDNTMKGAGSVQFVGDNGDVTVTDAEFMGAIYIYDGYGALNISGNTFRALNIGDTVRYNQGICVVVNSNAALDLRALYNANTFESSSDTNDDAVMFQMTGTSPWTDIDWIKVDGTK